MSQQRSRILRAAREIGELWADEDVSLKLMVDYQNQALGAVLDELAEYAGRVSEENLGPEG